MFSSMTQEQELFTILSSMILNKVYCRCENCPLRFKDSLFRVQGIQLLDSGGYMLLLECMDDLNGRFITYKISDIKPFLHPMSSMTEEQKNQWFNAINHYDKEGNPILTSTESINWLNANHFDYMGLIEKGIAIEAPRGIYTKCFIKK
jgi:hypothetical protein